jgi:hypothetical protein
MGAAIALIVISGLPTILTGQSISKAQEAKPLHQHQPAPPTQDETAKPYVLPPAQQGETRLRLEDLALCAGHELLRFGCVVRRILVQVVEQLAP